jgi:hypothetical protein
MLSLTLTKKKVEAYNLSYYSGPRGIRLTGLVTTHRKHTNKHTLVAAD